MLSKDINVSTPIHDLLARRWSGVAYDPARNVNDSDIRALAEAARWAPSCFGDEPWRYIICNKNNNPEAWQQAFDCLLEGNQSWCQHAPVLILTCHDTLLTANDKPNGWGQYDTGAASLSMCLQATHLGLMTHQMAGFITEKATQLFSIPDRYKPIAMMSVGYQLAEDKIPEDFKERETLPRTRKPIGEKFFLNSWGEGI
jgi:nitroreductase